MTPQERQLVADLFDRVARLEQSPREPDAEAAIADGLRRAPHAAYALVQTVLVQDEALKQAHARIQELEGGEDTRPQSGGFLGSMRDALLGSQQSRGSVPNVAPNDHQRPVWNTGQVVGQNDPRQGNPGGGLFGGNSGGGSFLGTAAATAAGVIGGSMLMNSFRGMMGGGQQQSLADTSSGASSNSSSNPWSGGSSGNSDLARDAGVNDIGKNTGSSGGEQKQSFADHASNETDNDDDDDGDDFGSDFDSGGDSDYA